MIRSNERKELLDRVNFSSTEEMVSLNEAVNKEFFVEQLEERLETDPLIVGGMFDLIQEKSVQMRVDHYCTHLCMLNFPCEEHGCLIHW